ncbi:hypothetical protein ACFVX3_31625 [Rhodococcus erythropolis]
MTRRTALGELYKAEWAIAGNEIHTDTCRAYWFRRAWMGTAVGSGKNYRGADNVDRPATTLPLHSQLRLLAQTHHTSSCFQQHVTLHSIPNIYLSTVRSRGRRR